MTRLTQIRGRQWPAVCGGVVAIVAGLAAIWPAAGQTLELTEVTRFNLNGITASELEPGGPLNPNYIGNNIVSVAWDGTRMFLAGFNNGAQGADSQNTGVIELLNTNQSGIVISTNVDYGPRMGFLPTINQRGYSGITFDGTNVYAAFDPGSQVAEGLTAFDVSDPAAPTTAWQAFGRGGSGVALDPGYVVGGTSQGGAGVAWATFGGPAGSANRRGLNDPATGDFIYGFSDPGDVPPGMQWPATTDAVFGRDIAFDPDTGDVYGRYSGVVSKAVRSGVNETTSQSVIYQPLGETPFVNYQTIAFMDDTTEAGDLLIWSQRDGATNLPFTEYVRLTDTDGLFQTATWNFLGGEEPVSGSGIYDYAFDTTSQTLAILDTSNFRASIFRFGAPDPDTQLRWAADGFLPGGSGIWDDFGFTWLGAYGQTAWVPEANALFGGDLSGTVTVGFGGVNVGRGLSFVTDGYTIDGDTITLTADSAFTNNIFVNDGLTATINAGLTATSGLAKSGGGTLVVGGTVSGGPLFVNNGTLVAAATASLAVTPGIVILETGTLDVTQQTGGLVLGTGRTLGGAGTVAGDLTVDAGATISPGSNLGTLSVTQGVTWASGGNYNWQILDAAGTAGTAPGWDLLSVGGILDISATSAEPFAVNLWSLSGADPDVNGDALNFDATQGYTWTIASATGGITGFAEDAFTINTAAANGAAGFSNDLGGGTFSLAVSGTDLNLVFTPGSGPSGIVIDVPSGSITQAQAGYPQITTATSVTKTGAGTVVFDAANSYTGPTTISAGTLEVTNANALASTNITVDTGATLSVASGTTMRAPSVIVDGGTLSAATLAVNSTTGITSLAINAGSLAGAPAVTVGSGGEMALVQDARVSVAVGSLAVDEGSGGGRLDVGAGQVSVATGGISESDLRADIIAGRNGGAWNGVAGITSSTAASSGGTRAVGYVVNGDGSATVSFAAPGDTDLSGQVNVFDLIGIDSAGKFGNGQAANWSQGDFNYDGVANVFDLIGIDSSGAYGTGPYFPAAPTAAAITAVPEPGLAGLLAVAAAGGWLALRRRR
jgi:autotransporter-associated beta strand protein